MIKRIVLKTFIWNLNTYVYKVNLFFRISFTITVVKFIRVWLIRYVLLHWRINLSSCLVIFFFRNLSFIRKMWQQQNYRPLCPWCISWWTTWNEWEKIISNYLKSIQSNFHFCTFSKEIPIKSGYFGKERSNFN